MSVSTIPVTITPKAAAHVADLGLTSQLEQMLDYLRQDLPRLKALEVEFQPDPEGGPPGIILHALLRDRLIDAEAEDRFRDWTLRTFSPQVWQHFSMFTVNGG
jgi:hypothetical protein